jgi:hypothetical protein
MKIVVIGARSPARCEVSAAPGHQLPLGGGSTR